MVEIVPNEVVQNEYNIELSWTVTGGETLFSNFRVYHKRSKDSDPVLLESVLPEEEGRVVLGIYENMIPLDVARFIVQYEDPNDGVLATAEFPPFSVVHSPGRVSITYLDQRDSDVTISLRNNETDPNTTVGIFYGEGQKLGEVKPGVKSFTFKNTDVNGVQDLYTVTSNSAFSLESNKFAATIYAPLKPPTAGLFVQNRYSVEATWRENNDIDLIWSNEVWLETPTRSPELVAWYAPGEVGTYTTDNSSVTGDIHLLVRSSLWAESSNQRHNVRSDFTSLGWLYVACVPNSPDVFVDQNAFRPTHVILAGEPSIIRVWHNPRNATKDALYTAELTVTNVSTGEQRKLYSPQTSGVHSFDYTFDEGTEYTVSVRTWTGAVENWSPTTTKTVTVTPRPAFDLEVDGVANSFVNWPLKNEVSLPYYEVNEREFTIEVTDADSTPGDVYFYVKTQEFDTGRERTHIPFPNRSGESSYTLKSIGIDMHKRYRVSVVMDKHGAQSEPHVFVVHRGADVLPSPRIDQITWDDVDMVSADIGSRDLLPKPIVQVSIPMWHGYGTWPSWRGTDPNSLLFGDIDLTATLRSAEDSGLGGTLEQVGGYFLENGRRCVLFTTNDEQNAFGHVDQVQAAAKRAGSDTVYTGWVELYYDGQGGVFVQWSQDGKSRMLSLRHNPSVSRHVAHNHFKSYIFAGQKNETAIFGDGKTTTHTLSGQILPVRHHERGARGQREQLDAFEQLGAFPGTVTLYLPDYRAVEGYISSMSINREKHGAYTVSFTHTEAR